jgi:hypothetical protein
MNRYGRIALMGLLAAVAVVFAGSSVAAATPELKNLPAELQKYVPDTPAFAAAPWMVSPTCRDKGGDFSIWTTFVLHDTPALLTFFQPVSFGDQVTPADRARRDMMLAGYRDLAGATTQKVPAGTCVEDVARWTGADPATPPFGLGHGVNASSTFAPFGVAWGAEITGGHQSGYRCVGTDPGTDRGGILGAERAPCDGFYLRCQHATTTTDQQRCASWNAFSDDYVHQVATLRGAAIAAHPAIVTGAIETQIDWTAVIVTGIALAAAGLLVVLAVRVLRRRSDHVGEGDDDAAHA